MFLPNATAIHRARTGYDRFGQETWTAPAAVRCAVVKLSEKQQGTAVRSDASASRGAAEEAVMDAKLLFTPDLVIGIGDQVEFDGFSMRVIGVHRRRNVLGRVDHIEVALEIVE